MAGMYIYQQIVKTTDEWAADTKIYPANILLFEKLEDGKFNIVVTDGIGTFSELQKVVVGVDAYTKEESDNRYPNKLEVVKMMPVEVFMILFSYTETGTTMTEDDYNTLLSFVTTTTSSSTYGIEPPPNNYLVDYPGSGFVKVYITNSSNVIRIQAYITADICREGYAVWVISKEDKLVKFSQSQKLIYTEAAGEIGIAVESLDSNGSPIGGYITLKTNGSGDKVLSDNGKYLSINIRPYGVAIDAKPTEDTLTYIVGDVTYNFELGMSAIYPDAESDDGYGISFFKGTNTEGKAIWGKRGGAGSLNETLIRSIAKEEEAKSSESFGIRWSLDDTVKTIEYVGNTALVDRFKSWVDSSAKPCEIKKDGTDFAYLTNTAGVESSTNWATREDGSASHYQTEDKADYLQMVELSNINIGSSINQLDRTMTVWFNTDTNCPAGFYRWFKAGKKLFARYDSTFNDDATTIDACYGTSQPTGNWSFDLAHTRTKATNTNLMNITAWEIICLSWIQAAYYQSFDMQTALATGYEGVQTAVRGYINGSTDTLTTPHGKISSGAFRFMYLENAFWGKQWLAGFGWRGEAGKGYLTFDDEKANKAATMALEDADVTMSYLTDFDGGDYCKNIDLFTMPVERSGSTTSGFCDIFLSSTSTSRVFYVGGASYIGSDCGAFARHLDNDASWSYWASRARCAMNR